jgi:hypothetical protein
MSNKEALRDALLKIVSRPTETSKPKAVRKPEVIHKPEIVDSEKAVCVENVECTDCRSMIALYNGPPTPLLCFDCGNTSQDAREEAVPVLLGRGRPEDGDKHDFGCNHTWGIYGYHTLYRNKVNIHIGKKYE